MIYVIAKSELKPGCREEYIKIAKANIPNVLAVNFDAFSTMGVQNEDKKEVESYEKGLEKTRKEFVSLTTFEGLDKIINECLKAREKLNLSVPIEELDLKKAAKVVG